ncbi:MAG: Hsp20/alpha crystallin family protein [Thermoplasmatales archaeon]|nr:Hsp20/alpha crystallin family protein [Thermoplasmatales archaeon]
MDWRKNKKDEDDFFGDFFGEDFDEEMRRMRKHMERLFREIPKGIDTGEMERKVYGPFVYGFSMKVGPDGKPQFREFGNTPRKGIAELGEREPLTDVIESEDSVSVTLEIPGVEKNDIALSATEDILTIDVDTPKRKYHKDVAMPCKVIPDSTAATYKNGILDVVMKKTENKKEEKKGKRIEIR